MVLHLPRPLPPTNRPFSPEGCCFIKKRLWPALDALFVFIGLLISVEFYFSLRVPEGHVVHLWRTLPILLCATMGALFFSGIYKSILRYAGVEVIIQSGVATLAGTGITYLISLLFYIFRGDGPNLLLMPRPVYFMQWVITLILILGSRFLIRYGQGSLKRHKGGKRILVIGAGYAGAAVIKDIQNGRYGDATAVAALDDEPGRQHFYLTRVPVVGGTDEIEKTVDRLGIDEIIIAIATPKGDIKELINTCLATGAHVMIYSGVREGAEARDVNIADLLGRPEQHLDMGEVREFFAGKRVMITGGGGSIGSELCRQILAFTPEKLVLYDISENYMYDLLFQLKEIYGELVSNTVVLEVGSVRDEESLWRVMGKYKPEVVIHAAAHKHVPLMEGSAEQAILNNVFGTYKTAKVSIECGVKRFVMISTDKAVNPTNVMGASKRLAEIIVNSIPNRGTQFSAVRFGNVLGSHGSVVPIFERQIRAGGPVTITDPNIIRYFMTIPEAASLVLQAASMARGGELFVLDMGEPVKIQTLAENMIRLSGRPNVQITYTGLRPGEKLYEELLLDRENDIATERDRIYITKQEKVPWPEVEGWLNKLEACLDTHGDVKETIQSILPSYHPKS